MKTDRMTVFPLNVFAKETKNGWEKDVPMRAYIQIITNGYAIYKADAYKDHSAGYKTYPSLTALLEDFDIDDFDMPRVEFHLRKELAEA